MRREQAILPIVIILFGSFLMFWPSSAKILISRVQIAGVSTTDEYVELYNFASSSQNITGWSLKKQTSGGTISNLVSSFAENSIINPFSYFLAAHRDYAGSVTPDAYYSSQSVSLAANNTLFLFDPEGEAVDRVDWGTVSSSVGSPAPNPPAGSQLIRLPDDDSGNHVDSDDSLADFVILTTEAKNRVSPSRPAGAIPDLSPPPSPTSTVTEQMPTSTYSDLFGIRLNEIVPNPESGEEWVEIINASSSTIDLSGGTLCDSRTTGDCTIDILTGSIGPGEMIIYYLSSNRLNNDGDSVILKNFFGSVIDSVSYSGDVVPEKGWSLARNLLGEWKISVSPTPGSENTITEPPVSHPTAAPISTGGSWSASPAPSLAKKTSATLKEIDNVRLLWNVSAPAIVSIGSTTLFDTHLTSDPRGGEIMYSWNFGDSSSLDGSRVYHSYAVPGIYKIAISGTSTQGTAGSKEIPIKVIDKNSANYGVYLSGAEPRPETGEVEWVAISSAAPTSTLLEGWKIETGAGRNYTIPVKTVLKPGNTLRFYKSVTKLALNNTGGSVILRDKEGTVVDILEFGKSKIGEIFLPSGTAPVEEEKNQKVLGVKIASAVNFKNYSGLPLADARNLPIKSKTTVTGEVISLPGQPYQNYFYISDDSGGIQIYSYKKSFPSLALGGRVRVSGEISSLQNTPRLRIAAASAIIKLPGFASSTNIEKNISEIDESDLGKLLTVQGEVTDLNSTSMYIDDASGELFVSLPARAGIDRQNLRPGTSVSVTGVLEQNTNGWKITPRTTDDVKTVIKNLPDANKPNKKLSALAGLSGGVLVIILGLIAKLWITKKPA